MSIQKSIFPIGSIISGSFALGALGTVDYFLHFLNKSLSKEKYEECAHTVALLSSKLAENQPSIILDQTALLKLQTYACASHFKELIPNILNTVGFALLSTGVFVGFTACAIRQIAFYNYQAQSGKDPLKPQVIPIAKALKTIGSPASIIDHAPLLTLKKQELSPVFKTLYVSSTLLESRGIANYFKSSLSFGKSSFLAICRALTYLFKLIILIPFLSSHPSDFTMNRVEMVRNIIGAGIGILGVFSPHLGKWSFNLLKEKI